MYTRGSTDQRILATYTEPTNTFTYNVPNNRCDGDGVCQFGFTDFFQSKSVRSSNGLGFSGGVEDDGDGDGDGRLCVFGMFRGSLVGDDRMQFSCSSCK